MKRKAFTLIELLVVIAIIAILAAILFPVFAQAKAAAKATASLSDVKQLALGSIMYSGDSDDLWMPAASWNTGSDLVTFSSGGVSPWDWLIFPYMKSAGILNDALAPAQPTQAGTSATFISAAYPQFGYNYDALSPYYADNGAPKATEHPISSTGVEQPANCIALSAKFAFSESSYGKVGNFTIFDVNGPLLSTTIDEPECYSIYSACLDNWGVNPSGQWYTFLNGVFAAGAITGGNSERGNGAGEVAFADGHAKKLSAGAQAAGTNWSPTQTAGNLQVTNISNYLWFAVPSSNGLQ